MQPSHLVVHIIASFLAAVLGGLRRPASRPHCGCYFTNATTQSPVHVRKGLITSLKGVLSSSSSTASPEAAQSALFPGIGHAGRERGARPKPTCQGGCGHAQPSSAATEQGGLKDRARRACSGRGRSRSRPQTAQLHTRGCRRGGAAGEGGGGAGEARGRRAGAAVRGGGPCRSYTAWRHVRSPRAERAVFT